MVQKINKPGNPATHNKDGWGSLYYIICDFNNDGKVPNPELLSVPPKPGATQKELSARIVIFSSGKDGPGDMGGQSASAFYGVALGKPCCIGVHSSLDRG